MATFTLNKNKHSNYAFFDPESKLHLTLSNPVGSVDVVTPAILKAVKNAVLIEVKNETSTEYPMQEQAQEDVPIEQPKRRGRKKTVLDVPAEEVVTSDTIVTSTEE